MAGRALVGRVAPPVAEVGLSPVRLLGDLGPDDVLVDAPLARRPLDDLVGRAGERPVHPPELVGGVPVPGVERVAGGCVAGRVLRAHLGGRTHPAGARCAARRRGARRQRDEVPGRGRRRRALLWGALGGERRDRGRAARWRPRSFGRTESARQRARAQPRRHLHDGIVTAVSGRSQPPGRPPPWSSRTASTSRGNAFDTTFSPDRAVPGWGSHGVPRRASSGTPAATAHRGCRSPGRCDSGRRAARWPAGPRRS